MITIIFFLLSSTLEANIMDLSVFYELTEYVKDDGTFQKEPIDVNFNIRLGYGFDLDKYDQKCNVFIEYCAIEDSRGMGFGLGGNYLHLIEKFNSDFFKTRMYSGVQIKGNFGKVDWIKIDDHVKPVAEGNIDFMYITPALLIKLDSSHDDLRLRLNYELGYNFLTYEKKNMEYSNIPDDDIKIGMQSNWSSSIGLSLIYYFQ